MATLGLVTDVTIRSRGSALQGLHDRHTQVRAWNREACLGLLSASQPQDICPGHRRNTAPSPVQPQSPVSCSSSSFQIDSSSYELISKSQWGKLHLTPSEMYETFGIPRSHHDDYCWPWPCSMHGMEPTQGISRTFFFLSGGSGWV